MHSIARSCSAAIAPLNHRDTEALEGIFEACDGDPTGELEAVLSHYFGSRHQGRGNPKGKKLSKRENCDIISSLV
ncbi:hypothetical protein [Phormidium sp. CCY1219]|uniref:hypothetical protein n=1 Tax=Phormidium sp. CCY1219 TaxID=2886104 RepID=UPI002D1F6D36|nr:hypothetical protein [Phormidium sp. CCY1219]MEB3830455.1 hypothetical protein [Phormidium sp. CCY1219]